MLRSIADRLNYSNVVATLALFIALGGSSYAALKIGSGNIRDGAVQSRDLRNNDIRGRDVRNRSLTSSDIRENALGGFSVNESRLGVVPQAFRATTLQGLGPDAFKVRCPADTLPRAGACVEENPSAPTTFPSASDECQSRGRRIASYVELEQRLVFDGNLAPGGEFTSDVYIDTNALNDEVLHVVVVTEGGGTAAGQPALTPSTKAFRCSVTPIN
jgi:hypothetical protein